MNDSRNSWDTQNIDELLETVKNIVSDPDVTIEEAFYAPLLMENSELEEIYDRLIGSLSSDHPLLFKAIHASLRSHHQSFIEGAAHFCKDRGVVEAFKNMGSAS